MYADYFGLSEPPFSIAPDPRYLYPSAQHLEALAHLAYGASEGNGFIQLTGEVGTGKTTLIRRLLADLPEGVEIAFLFNPEVSPRGLLSAFLAELGLPRPPPGATHDELVARVHRHLLAAHTRGRRVVLVIDEAQRLGPEVLEEVRLLTNFETDRRKLLNVILVGQPELRETLARPDLRQLAQRITARYHLGPFALVETDAYIRHRLRLAGAPGRIFKPAAVRAVQRHSRGIPRLINLICDRALMAAYTRGLREVNANVVTEAVLDIAGSDARRRGLRPAWIATGLVAAAVAGGALAWWFAGGERAPPPRADGFVAAVARPAPTRTPAMAIVAASPPSPKQVVSPAGSSGSPIGRWLAAQPASAGTAAAELLALWHIPGGASDACAAAAGAGLACLHEQGNLNLLSIFNRPAVVALNTPGGRFHAVVKALSAERITLISTAGRTRSFPLAAFTPLWYGRMWLLWRPPHGAVIIRRGMSGPAVAWLRAALGLPADSVRAVYDGSLEDAVRAFQRQHALVPDGIAGPETLLVMRGIRGEGAGPRLRGG